MIPEKSKVFIELVLYVSPYSWTGYNGITNLPIFVLNYFKKKRSNSYTNLQKLPIYKKVK